ncbi:T6SS effector amidase Tae4 family protein [Serratia marcescens]|uniref:T6SS effector amidase Tae4 family protein n=1 Tax=Serratia marcescens TaxID=615 RepID=UPI003ED95FCA
MGMSIHAALSMCDKAFDDQCAIRIGAALVHCGYDVSKLSGVNFCWLHKKSEGHILRAEELANTLGRCE